MPGASSTINPPHLTGLFAFQIFKGAADKEAFILTLLLAGL